MKRAVEDNNVCFSYRFYFTTELLMEEFRIAHQRMFGGKENDGDGGDEENDDGEQGAAIFPSKIKAAHQKRSLQSQKSPETSVELSTTASQKGSCMKSFQRPEPPPPPPTLPFGSAKTKAGTQISVSPARIGTTKAKEIAAPLPLPPPPVAVLPVGRLSQALPRPEQKSTTTSSNSQSSSSPTIINDAGSSNRITIKVLSPKIGT